MLKREGHDESDYRAKHDHTRPDLSAERHEKNKIIPQNLWIRICGNLLVGAWILILKDIDSQLCHSGADVERTLENC